MKNPIYVYEPNDLAVFETLEEAERCIEPIDVQNEEFLYYDADGQVLAASVAFDKRGLERTEIHETSEKAFQPEKLREILLSFLVAVGESPFAIRHLSLEELVGRSLKYRSL